MTKKRIADLLKEEVEKTDQAEQPPAESKTQSTVTDASTTTNETTKSSGSAGRTRKRSSKPSSTAKTTAAKKTAPASDLSGLEQKIQELEAALSEANKQITGLQGDLETHQTRIFELKDEVTASKKVTADKTAELDKVSKELETAKETIRKITAAQADKPETTEQTQRKVVHGADLATNRNTLSLRNRPSSYKAIPEYAIQRGEQNSMLSDDDIGWVD